ncbi:MAG: MBG domain-containing protein [Clostridiales bacterium]|nr:MBG domain-containing protein [Clostridiales bacterium]
MKRKCKQLTALVLALSMCLSLLSATAWAADLSAEADLVAEEAQEDPEPAADEADAAEEESAGDEADQEAQSDEEIAPAEEEVTVEAEEAQAETPAEEESTEEEAAGDESGTTVSVSSTVTETSTTTYINPLYADVITEDDLVQPSEDEADAVVHAAADSSFTTLAEAAEFVREEMKNRTQNITLYYFSTTDVLSNASMSEIFEMALEHTGDPEEGDYLAYQYAGMKGSLIGYVETEETLSSDGVVTNVEYLGYTSVITYTVTYYTDAKQEAEVTAKVDKVLDELGVDDMSDYHAIEAIYDYICSNVVYDYEDLSDSDEVLEYTAYNALINGTAVCQGYAVLFYRMALEAGVDARVVSGTGINSEGNTKNHAWDIVRVGSYYYNVDATWDEASYLAGIDYRYFLLGEDNFNTNHFRGSEYTTTAFYSAYPMSDSDYPEETEIVDLSTCTVTLSATSYTYNGSAKKPTVTVKNGSTTLTSGTDYTVSYSNNTNAGTATVTVTGKGNYTGSVTKTFTINKASISGYTVTLSATSYTYDGNPKKPTVTVKNGSTTLTSDDYTVSYSNYTNAGTATVTVSGKGNYTDSAKKTFTINKAETTASATNYSGTYDGSAHTFKLTVSGPSSYTVYYSTSTQLTSSNYSSSGSTTKPTRTNAGGTTVYCYVKDNTGNYKNVSGTVYIYIKPKVSVSAYSGTYNGSARSATVTATGNATVYYSTSTALTYSNYSTSGSTTKPTRTNAGTTTVYYIAVPKSGIINASTVTAGSTSITIAKASQTVTASAAASSIYAGKTTTVTGKGTGTITYSSSDTSVATVSSSGVVTGKKPGTVTITVKAAGNSNYNAASKTVKITVKLNKTTISSLTNTSSGVTVTWSKVTGASGYYIYRNNTKVKTITSGSTVSYIDTKAKTNGTKYQYKIYAYYGSTKSAVSATKTTYYVSTPTISSLTNSASKKMTVKWGKNTKATGYQIQYSTSSSFSSYKTVTVSSYSTVSKTISSLTKNKKYYVRVRAYKTVSGTKYYSAWSSTKNVKISK